MVLTSMDDVWRSFVITELDMDKYVAPMLEIKSEPEGFVITVEPRANVCADSPAIAVVTVRLLVVIKLEATTEFVVMEGAVIGSENTRPPFARAMYLD